MDLGLIQVGHWFIQIQANASTISLPSYLGNFVLPLPIPKPAYLLFLERLPNLVRENVGADFKFDEFTFDANKVHPEYQLKVFRKGYLHHCLLQQTSPMEWTASVPDFIPETLLSIMYGETAFSESTILTHAGAASLHGNAFIYSGLSGKGKSTLSRLLAKAGAEILHDDRLLINHNGKSCVAYNLPRYQNDFPRSLPFRKVFFLEHGLENSIRPMSRSLGIGRMLSHSFVPSAGNAKLLELIKEVCNTLEFYEFHFKPDQSAVTHLVEHFHSP